MIAPSAPRDCRVPFDRPLQLMLLEGDRPPERLRAMNLSRGGMFVEAEELLPEGTRVALALEACGKVLPFAEGEVTWQKEGEHADGALAGFGLRFTLLGPRAQALIEHLIARGGTGAPEGDAPAPPVASDAPASPPIRAGARRGKRAWRVAGALAGVAGVAALAGTLSRPTAHPRAPSAPVAQPTPAAPVECSAAPAAPPARTAAALASPALPVPTTFAVAIPSGAVRALRVTLTSRGVAVEPTLRRHATVRHIFNLPRPVRVVIDVAGGEPASSWRSDGNALVEAVRVGARNHGTRVVVDLPESLAGLHVRVREANPPLSVASIARPPRR